MMTRIRWSDESGESLIELQDLPLMRSGVQTTPTHYLIVEAIRERANYRIL